MVVWGSIRNIPWTPRYKWLVCRSKKIKVLLVFASNTKPHAVYNTRLLHLCCLASHQSCHPHDGSLVSLSSMTTSQFSSRVVVSQIGIPHKAVNLESELSGESKPRTEGDLTDNQATKAMPQIDELKAEIEVLKEDLDEMQKACTRLEYAEDTVTVERNAARRERT